MYHPVMKTVFHSRDTKKVSWAVTNTVRYLPSIVENAVVH